MMAGGAGMPMTIEAIYSNGVFRPLGAMDLAEGQRVRITLQSVDLPTEAERAAALERFFRRIDALKIRIEGPLPTRDEMHERG